MAVAFSSDGSVTIETTLSSCALDRETADYERRYSLEICKKWIHQNSLSRVALQIPDELQKDAAVITEWIEANTEAKCFVQADTSYGSCCVDEVAAEHYQADSIIHFGHSCLSPSRRLPTLLVFEKASIDVQDCCEQLKDQVPDEDANVILLYDVSYFHVVDDIQQKLQEHLSKLVVSALNVSVNCTIAADNQIPFIQTGASEDETTNCDKDNCIRCCGRVIKTNQKSLENHTVFFIGHESLTLSNFMVLWNKCTFYSYNPESRVCRRESGKINRVLGKRYYLVEKAKDAQIVGIVVGTLGVANYLQVIERMKSLLKKVGKKCYTFAMGKLNVAKLANFMEIDIFVLIACPENSLLDNAEFYKPVITPYELELACNPERQWTGGIVTDFQAILTGGESHVPLPEGDIEEHTDISLITGAYRKMGVRNDDAEEDEKSSALVARNPNTQVALSGAGNAGEFLSQRSWQGLEPALGQTPVTKAVEGRKGIAISYEEEPQSKQ